MNFFNGALHLMKRRVRVEGELWWLTTPKGATRNEIAAIQKRVTRLAGRSRILRLQRPCLRDPSQAARPYPFCWQF